MVCAGPQRSVTLEGSQESGSDGGRLGEGPGSARAIGGPATLGPDLVREASQQAAAAALWEERVRTRNRAATMMPGDTPAGQGFWARLKGSS